MLIKESPETWMRRRDNLGTEHNRICSLDALTRAASSKRVEIPLKGTSRSRPGDVKSYMHLPINAFTDINGRRDLSTDYGLKKIFT
jgi:hypothetical protein